jgi:tRNA A-37 threonylcarbamoyl transferase component Bud32/tetratricopeptide (TPR) repeat protein/TolB-like protein
VPDELERLRNALADRYAIESEIGSGGMATVYLAEDLRHHRKVAVKVLRSELAAALGPDRFLREIEIAARLQHPHILPLYDSGEAAGFLYYVMPYVSGESLRARLSREGELPIAEAVRILRDVADALAHAHGESVVHRDIKPDNVMLSGRHALVTDFGVAKAVSEATGRNQLTTAGVALGTPAYMAPEQAAADPNIDHRADVYALGALAYELLSGRPPFTGTTPQMVLSAHITQAPDPVTRHRASVPPALEQLVMRCLEKKPADRWQSVEELLPQLEALTTPSGGITPAQTTPVSAVRPKRTGAIVGAVAAFAILGALGAWYLIAGRGSPLEGSRVVVAPFEDLTGDPEYADLGRIAANYVTQKLQETDLVSIVPAMDVAGIAFSSARDLAQQTGAGLVIAGDYYLDGDSLFFRSEIIDAAKGEVLSAPALAGAARADRMAAVEALRQRVLGALAMHVDPEIADWVTAMSSAPTFEAYREWTICMQSFTIRAFADAVEHCSNAYAADTSFLDVLGILAVAHNNRGEYALADSVATVLSGRQERLAGLSRLTAQWLRALLNGDVSEQLRLVRAAQQEESVPVGWKYQLGLDATRNNRPREAIEALERMDPDQGVFRDWFSYWTVLAGAYHMVGDHEGELEVARMGRERHRDELAVLNTEVRALIGLGRVDEALALLEQSLTLEAPGYTPAGSMRLAALELRAHGFPDDAAPLLERAVAWYRALPPARLAEQRRSLAYALFCQGGLEEAEELYRQLRVEEPETVGHLGHLGVIAARAGRPADARAIADSLAAWDVPYTRGQHTFYRAGIAAWLGDKERAVALLQQAFREGSAFSVGLHTDPKLQPLWDHAPFREFLRPRG